MITADQAVLKKQDSIKFYPSAVSTKVINKSMNESQQLHCFSLNVQSG